MAVLLPTLTVASDAAVATSEVLPQVRLSVQALDLTRTPSTEELMAAGQFGGPLHPTRDGLDPERKDLVNLSFGRAIQAWNDHEWDRAANLFHRHVADYPDSPWASEAVLHLGCEARYNGRYGEAEELLNIVVASNRAGDHPGAKMLLNKARQRLAVLDVLQGDFPAAAARFAELKKESPDWRHRTYAAHWIQRLSRYRSGELALLNCGAQALAHVLRRDEREDEARQVLDVLPTSSSGHSMADLRNLAAQYDYELTGRQLEVAELRRIPLPAIVQIDGVSGDARGHYWVLEKVRGRKLRLFDPQSRRRFSQTFAEFAQEWDGNVLIFSRGETLPGVALTQPAMAEIRGGCCGAPRSESDLGCGAPVWMVNPINMNLYVRDTPMWYRPAIGPPVEIKLSYNSLSAISFYEPFGNKWQSNFTSYLVVDPGGSVKIFMPDGRRDDYTPNGFGGYQPPVGVYDSLIRLSSSRYELTLQDGTVYGYDMPTVLPQASTCTGCPPVTLIQHVLVQVRDGYGQSLDLGYDGMGQLSTIQDAVGNVTTFGYDANGRVLQVADPFGRTADFEYDPQGNLTAITDMGGYRADLTYDADVYLTGINKSGLQWTFLVEPADGIVANSDMYPPPGDSMWENYRITITDPTGAMEEYFYYAGCDPDFDLCSGYSWHVSPRDYIEWRGPDVNNYVSKAPKTRYFPGFGGGATGQIIRILTPEGQDTTFEYGPDGNPHSITDSHGHSTLLSYNTQGQVTSVTEPGGNVRTFTYAANGVDLIQESDGLGTIVRTYNQAHDVTSVTDALQDTVSATYNALGQLIAMTDPLGKTVTLEYGSDLFLSRVERDSKTVLGRTHDPAGRITTETDSTGLTLTFTYNDLDKVTSVGYPDGRSVDYTYTTCCTDAIESMTDRGGKQTRYLYDDLRRFGGSISPEGAVMRISYDPNGNPVQLTDAAGHRTSMAYDLDNRPLGRTYHDGSSETYRYDAEGLLVEIVNARGTSAHNTYDAMHRLLSTTYTDGTPAVSYEYDLYGRLTQRVDGIGTYAYTYDATGQMETIDGPWPADTVTLQYDEFGARTGVAVQGGPGTTYGYDGLGRLESVLGGAGLSLFSYQGASPLPDDVTRPDGGVTAYLYDGLNRRTDVVHRDSTATLISQHTYTYDTNDLRTSETRVGGLSAGAAENSLIVNDPDELNQLASYAYDADGNMTQGVTPDGYLFTAAYDAESRLATLEYTDGNANVQRTEYHYNGDNFLARIVKREDGTVVGERRFVRVEGLTVQERDGANTVLADYTWRPQADGGIGGLLYARLGGADHTYLYDGEGSVTTVLDPTESVVAEYAYDPFGNLVATAGTLDQEFGFSTKRYDRDTGLAYFGYRFYSPSLGRWTTRDPIREKGGIHLYAFVDNSPVNLVDPWGLSAGGTCVGATPGPRIAPWLDVWAKATRYWDYGLIKVPGGYKKRPAQKGKSVRLVTGWVWAHVSHFVTGMTAPSAVSTSNAVVGVRG